MKNESHVPRRFPPASRSARLGLVALAALVVALPTAWASHTFGDVLNTSPHHDDVPALAEAGITAGCNPPANTAYCPDAAVRRDQMASFLRRGLGRAASDAFTASPTPTTYDTPVGAIPITPGLASGARPGAAGFVTVNAQITIYVPSATGCPCLFLADLWSEETGYLTSHPGTMTVTTAGYHPLSLTGIGRFTSPGAKVIGVYVARTDGTAQSEVFGQATAQYLPFGSAGGNVITTAAGADAQNGPRPQRP
jgi:hypothetical protein